MNTQDYETQLDNIIERLSLAIDNHDEIELRKAYEEILKIQPLVAELFGIST